MRNEEKLKFTENTIENGEDFGVFDIALKVLEQEESNNDCISRQATLEPYQTLNDNDVISVGTIRRNIKEMPSFIPLKNMGQWLEVDTNMYSCNQCNNCFTLVPEDNNILQFNFCPECGAKMEKGSMAI